LMPLTCPVSCTSVTPAKRGDHPRRGHGQLGSPAGERLPVRHGEQVGAQVGDPRRSAPPPTTGTARAPRRSRPPPIAIPQGRQQRGAQLTGPQTHRGPAGPGSAICSRAGAAAPSAIGRARPGPRGRRCRGHSGLLFARPAGGPPAARPPRRLSAAIRPSSIFDLSAHSGRRWPGRG